MGQPFESAVIQSYAKNEKHTIRQRNDRCLLLILSRSEDMSPKELIALVLNRYASLAATKHDHKFRPASFAFDLGDLFSETKVRAYSETANLAGFDDVLILPGAAGHASNFVRDCAWYLRQKPEPLPFIVVDTTLSHYRISLVIVTGRSTGVQVWTRWEADVPEPQYDRVFEVLLQCLESCAGRHVVGVLVTGTQSYSPSSRSRTLSMIRSALHARSTELGVQEME
jgi:hypothetical protein